MHKAWFGAVQTCQLITSGRDKFGNSKKLHKSTGAINVALKLCSFTVLFILTALTEYAVQKVLNYCGHDGFPCHGNTSCGIHNIPLYVFHEKIPVCFSQQTMYYMPAVSLFHMVDDTLLQWLHVLVVFGSRC
jgi:hypothetical protein